MTETGRDMSQEARPLWTFKEVSELLSAHVKVVPTESPWQNALVESFMALMATLFVTILFFFHLGSIFQ